MRTITATLTAASVAILAVVVVLAARSPAAMADEPQTAPRAPERPFETLLGARALPEPVEAVEVLDALHYWTRVDEETLRPWANAIVTAVQQDCANDDPFVQRGTAIWIASQAAVESRFAPEVLDYSCNDAAYRARHIPGECDNGWAFGPWQMHDMNMKGAAPEAQAKRALQWMRARPQAWTTWRAARAQADAWLGAR